MEVHILLHDGGSVGNPGGMIIFPNVFDLMCGFALYHRNFHDLSELARTGISEGK